MEKDTTPADAGKVLKLPVAKRSGVVLIVGKKKLAKVAGDTPPQTGDEKPWVPGKLAWGILLTGGWIIMKGFRLPFSKGSR